MKQKNCKDFDSPIKNIGFKCIQMLKLMICSNITTYIRTWCYFLKKWESPSIKAPDLQKK